MTKLESKIIDTHLPASTVYEFLTVLANHEQIMPEQVSDWQVDGDTCQYVIKGTGSVHLKVKERKENHLISLEPNGRIPFPFEVVWRMTPHRSGCEVQAIMNAELNPILKMIAAGPLSNFINLQVENLNRVLHEEKSA